MVRRQENWVISIFGWGRDGIVEIAIANARQ